MNLAINVKDFLNKNHVKLIENKITEAIEEMDFKDLVQDHIYNSDLWYDISQGIDVDSVATILTEKLKNSI